MNIDLGGWKKGLELRLHRRSVFRAGRETINTQAVSGALVSEPGYLVYTTHGPLRINVAFHGELITQRAESLSSGSPERKNRRSRLTHCCHSSTKSF